MPDAILVLNAGSSSIKFAAFGAAGDRAPPLFRGQVDGIGTAARFLLAGGTGAASEEVVYLDGEPDHDRALQIIFEHCRGRSGGHRPVAVGHRIVHGGVSFAAPVRVDPAVLAALDQLVPLAPLHQPHGLAAVRAVARTAPHLPQVACFDTAFHRTQPEVAQRFALPRRFTDEGIRRYGFHGLSYEFVASALPGYDAAAAAGRTVVAHLGNGASLCALLGGRSVATTMGFTPADGLVMGTRVGALDPGVLLYLMDRHGMAARDLEHLLYHESGLLGVSGVSGDMRAPPGEPRPPRGRGGRPGRLPDRPGARLPGGRARRARRARLHRRIGEHAAAIRARVCRSAAWLGADLDEAANGSGGPRISRPGSKVAVWVIPTNEEAVIAGHTRRVLGLAGGGS